MNHCYPFTKAYNPKQSHLSTKAKLQNLASRTWHSKLYATSRRWQPLEDIQNRPQMVKNTMLGLRCERLEFQTCCDPYFAIPYG